MYIDALRGLSFDMALELIRPAIIFALVLAAYTMTVFYFCRFISRRDVIRFQYAGLRSLVARNTALRVLLFSWIWSVRYGVLFPIVAYGWFIMLTVMLAILYNSREPAQLILISMSVITAVRVTAYLDEDLSRDIARILPFALLGLFIASFSDIEIEATLRLLRESVQEWERLLYYWVYVILQELVLRFGVPVVRVMQGVYVELRQWWVIRQQQQARTAIAGEVAEAVDVEAEGEAEWVEESE